MTWSRRPTSTSECLLHQLSALARASNSTSKDALRKLPRESELRLDITLQHFNVSRCFNLVDGILNLNHYVFNVRNMILEKWLIFQNNRLFYLHNPS